MKHQWIKYISLSQRKGIFVLLGLVIILQLFIYLVGRNNKDIESVFDLYNANFTEAMQSKIDSIKIANQKMNYELTPFNPNYITDYRGYILGMSVEEIDRLHVYRKLNKFVNSAEEFQSVTKISDSLLAKLSPYFKFPDWVTTASDNRLGISNTKSKTKDINKASKEDLMVISGVGAFTADKILEEREKLGGFVSIDQISYVYSISNTTLQNIKNVFVVNQKTPIKRININTCSKEDLQKLPYITSSVAKQIVIYRSRFDRKLEIEDLGKINDFPIDKIKIITLYLDF